MGDVLKRTALSPNVKDRLDYSCAFFDEEGRIVSQAAHIPVHLGSMAYAMTSIVSGFKWCDGDVVVLNDPFLGGTHLPDVTMVSPFFFEGDLLGFVANRAHHANIGSSSAGSMPLTRNLSEEGILISPVKLMSEGRFLPGIVSMLSAVDPCSNRTVLPGDFQAQVSSNQLGLKRLGVWLSRVSDPIAYFESGLQQINQYGSAIMRDSLKALPDGVAQFHDVMDGDGFGVERVKIQLELSVINNMLTFDFTGTDRQVEGNINCPISVCAAAVYYSVCCILPDYIPHCHGVFRCIHIVAPEGCLVNAYPGAAVSSGNVETSMRLVDVVLGCLSKLGVNHIPAASHGTMNNVAVGGIVENKRWDYYETIGGGGGAGSNYPGLSASQCHMTNTLNTPVESVELHYPLRINEYSLRSGSGGKGAKSGGDGIVRSYEFLEKTDVTVLSERRIIAPWGVLGGGKAEKGLNLFNNKEISGKCALTASGGDLLTILSPGGGGWGQEINSIAESCETE